jgi:hypothetical protein
MIPQSDLSLLHAWTRLSGAGPAGQTGVQISRPQMRQQTETSDFDGAAVDDEEMELLSVTLAASRYQMSCDNVMISTSARSAPKSCAASLALADLDLSLCPNLPPPLAGLLRSRTERCADQGTTCPLPAASLNTRQFVSRLYRSLFGAP